jgi:citrate lyase subunit beta/citryl-CoA lyase
MLEVAHRIPAGSIRLIPMITETAKALLQMQSFARAPARVLAMTWGAEDLAVELGASGNRNESGEYQPTYQWASSLCQCAAAAAGVMAIDTVDTEIRDLSAMGARALRSRKAGYVGKLAIHPAQIAPLHEAFTPSAEEVAHAERIMTAFADAAGQGALRLDGKLIDRPHLLQAERTLAAAKAARR